MPRDPIVAGLSIDPETRLDDAERGALISILDTDGFTVLRKLMLVEIARFDLALKNAERAEDVIIKHNIAKAASQFYVQLIDRLNKERELVYVGDGPQIFPSVTDAITDPEE